MTSKHKPLKTLLEDKFSEQQLSQQQLDLLQKMQANQPGNTPSQTMNKHRPNWLWACAATAACLALALFIGLTPVQTNSLALEIAQEAAKNHLKLKPLEVNASEIPRVREYFTELDFLPVNSALLAQLALSSSRRLIGGRYCSLKGISAAQLRYQDQQGSISTLYEVPYDPDIYGPIPSLEQGESPIVIFAKGVKNSLWQEKGLLMVLTESSAQ